MPPITREMLRDYIHEALPDDCQNQEARGNGKKDAEMSRKLSTIVTDLDIDFNLEDCVPKEFNHPAIVAELQELEFKSLIARIPVIGGSTAMNIEPKEIEPVKNLTLQAGFTYRTLVSASPTFSLDYFTDNTFTEKIEQGL